MQFKNDGASYGAVSRALHWLIALLMVGLMIVGFYMTGLDREDPSRRAIYGFHKSMGVLVLELVLLRLLWISYSRPPLLPSALKVWEKGAAKLAHIGLYAMMVLLPVSGYMMSTAGGFPVGFFEFYQVPALFEKNKELADAARATHELLSYATIALFLAHVAGAVKHRYVDPLPEADVLKRML